MGWETRGGKEYYYSKEWENGTCVSRYIGAGEVADLIGQCEWGRQIEKRRERAQKQQQRLAEQSIDDEIDNLSELNKTLVDALFLLNGYHQHKRQWRKKR